MKKSVIRILSLLMVAAMLLCMVPATALAADTNTIQVVMTDSYGDGWGNNMLHMFIDGNFYTNLVLEDGGEDTWSMEFTDSVFTFYWGLGSYSNECGFTIIINGETVYSIGDCSELLDDQFVYTSCTHPGTYEETVDACCTLEGGTYLRCIKCHNIMDTLEIVPPTGHDFVDGVCSVCGDTPRLIIEMKDSYGDGWNGAAIELYIDNVLEETLTVEETNNNWSTAYDENKRYVLKWVKGEYDSECQARIFLNGLEEIGIYDFTDIADGEVIFSNCNHTYGEGVIHEPTCEANGYTLYTCTICGYVLKDDYVYATGHIADESATVVVPPTCTGEGYTIYQCSVCGETYDYEEDVVPPLGHDYDENGICTICGKSDRVLVYFMNTEGWETIYAHAYDSEQNPYGDTSYTLTWLEDDIYYVELPNGTSYVEFYSDAGNQTDILLIPDDGNNLYYGFGWGKYQSITLHYPNLTLDGEVKIGVYFGITDKDIDWTDLGLAVFDSYMPEGTMDDAIYATQGSIQGESEFAVFTRGIPAKNLGDTIYFKVFYQLDDGVYIYSDMKSYSGKTYAKNTLAKNNNPNAQALAVALMNYGAQAQLFFDYKTDDLMNSWLTDEQKALAPEYQEDMITPITPVPASQQGSFYPRSGFDSMYATSTLEGEIQLNYYFTVPDSNIAILDAHYWYYDTLQEGEVFTKDNAMSRVFINQNSEGLFCFTCSLPAPQINKPLYVAVTYIDNDDVEYSTGVLAYSFGMYLKNTISKGSDEMVALAKATAVYGYMAQEYFQI